MIETHKRLLPLVAVVVSLVLIGVLGSMIWSRAAILRSGQVVELEVRPVDPRDLLRGDYVIVSYTISQLPQELLEAHSKQEYSSDFPVYVRLKAGSDGLWQATKARLDTPFDAPGAEGEVDIRGIVNFMPARDGGDLSVEYGIERFYLPEGQGRPIEEGLGVRPFRMKVAVASDGSPQIKSFHDGETLIFTEPLY